MKSLCCTSLLMIIKMRGDVIERDILLTCQRKFEDEHQSFGLKFVTRIDAALLWLSSSLLFFHFSELTHQIYPPQIPSNPSSLHFINQFSKIIIIYLSKFHYLNRILCGQLYCMFSYHSIIWKLYFTNKYFFDNNFTNKYLKIIINNMNKTIHLPTTLTQLHLYDFSKKNSFCLKSDNWQIIFF